MYWPDYCTDINSDYCTDINSECVSLAPFSQKHCNLLNGILDMLRHKVMMP